MHSQLKLTISAGEIALPREAVTCCLPAARSDAQTDMLAGTLKSGWQGCCPELQAQHTCCAQWTMATEVEASCKGLHSAGRAPVGLMALGVIQADALFARMCSGTFFLRKSAAKAFTDLCTQPAWQKQ